MPVTSRQRQVYDFISRFIEAHKQPPTIAEIGKQFKMSFIGKRAQHSVGSGARGTHQTHSQRQSRHRDYWRKRRADSYEIPLLGTVAAGQPIEAILAHETVAGTEEHVGHGRMFALRVRGDSMIDENIQDDDIIIVSSQQTAENGQMVVALIDGNYATVKKFYREPDFIRLEPANPQFKPIFIKTPERIEIQGVVRGLIRRYDAVAGAKNLTSSNR